MGGGWILGRIFKGATEDFRFSDWFFDPESAGNRKSTAPPALTFLCVFVKFANPP